MKGKRKRDKTSEDENLKFSMETHQSQGSAQGGCEKISTGRGKYRQFGKLSKPLKQITLKLCKLSRVDIYIAKIFRNSYGEAKKLGKSRPKRAGQTTNAWNFKFC